MEAIILFALKLLDLVPLAIKTGGDVISIINNGSEAIKKMQAEGRGPTDAEWSNLNATIDGLMSQLKD